MMISEPTPFTHSFNFNDLHPLTSPLSYNSTSTMSHPDDVTTIFVVGFPEDMSEREFQNMFTFCRGFEAASLKWHCKDQEDDMLNNGGKKQMIGFARFKTRLEALESIEVLSGKKIDQEKGTVLKAEMAKKNLHIKRATTGNSVDLKPSIYDHFSPLPSDLFHDSDILMDDSLFRKRPVDQNPPCNTLYVGNLPLNTSEEELSDLFSNREGYRRMCFRTKSQGPMCFVEFEDIPSASHTLNELQGHALTNSVKGRIRLSYSKNPLFIKPNKESTRQWMNDNKRDFIF
ncbi:hypothetical protein G6F57_003240 [Rhizopus arrhizus]|nr:hypothetical protein G6F30_003343 [Rhizopus arrhizus]KAG1417643.1 hypothetical protein G6F58_005414 [Rhizopus delemar]KAG0979376.1 hypothetical protein G6F29_008623 [Rhizopus arrhizus]KAG0995225.1 hypothetical protein G6F28_004995 [Rhizopus arrhizus]KAG1008869.1 hypothetical protein G6F27_006098 [Rhizopus arrhizus]